PITTYLFVHLHFIDDAHDRRVDRAVLEARRHPGRTAADDEDGLADTGIHGIDGHQIVALELASRIDRSRDQQLAADQPRIFSRGDNRPDDLGQKHDGEI